MRIITTAKAATAIGAKSGGEVPTEDNAQLVAVITDLLPKIEEALNVQSLVRGPWIDTFRLPLFAAQEGYTIDLRLANGFLVSSEDVTLEDPDGVQTVLTEDQRLDELGIIKLDSCARGIHKVYYTSGFAPVEYVAPDPAPPEYSADNDLSYTNPLLQDVPEWLQTIAVTYVVDFYRRIVLAPKFPGKGDAAAGGRLVISEIRRELASRIYGRYMRPRANVEWAEKTVAAP